MKTFLDTSVLVATFYGDHPNHDACLGAFRRCKRSDSFCAAHTLAELYAVMGRLPVRPGPTAEQCRLFVDEVEARVSPVALAPPEYLKTIRDAAGLGITGGAIYDALILACARKCAASRIYTLNLKHFQRLAPDLASHICVPD